MKTALITGAFGQDGYYLVHELLQSDNYSKIYCTGHRIHKLDEVYLDDRIQIDKLDISNHHEIASMIKLVQPDELYHLASFSAPIVSWDDPEFVVNLNAIATIQILESIRMYSPKTRLFFASSAKIFGKPAEMPQNEDTPVSPQDPYSLGKYTAHQAVALYRQKYGLYACNGIMYNHESYLKNLNFVTRKICYYAVQLKKNKIESFDLIDLNPRIDLGDPRDYAKAMATILQQKNADDYIIATNSCISIEEICKIAGEILGLPDILTHINVSSPESKPPKKYYRGDNSKLIQIGWAPQYSQHQTIQQIIDYDLAHDELDIS